MVSAAAEPSSINTAFLYLRTARNLKTSQLLFYPLRKLQRRLPWHPPAVGPFNDAVLEEWARVARFRFSAAERLANADAVLAGHFKFLDVAQTMQMPAWHGTHPSPLWRYQLHYFEFAVDLAVAWTKSRDARYAQRLERLVDSWIEDNPPVQGAGWDPYPIARRIRNWLYALSIADDGLSAATRTRMQSSIFQQLAYLFARREKQFLANHYFSNLSALLIGSTVFRGARARGWHQYALGEIARQIEMQILDDGGHFERSPMYHAIVMEELLEVIALGDVPASHIEGFREAASRMADAYARLTRPNGAIRLFNDAALDGAPHARELGDLARPLIGELPQASPGDWSLPQSGYFGTRVDGDAICVDFGPPGPGYNPAHAHCDIGSFELDFDGQPVIVDTGTGGYDGDALRAYSRSTAAHSCFTLAGMEQSEAWGTFRMARQASVREVATTNNSGRWTLRGSYSPFYSRHIQFDRTIEFGGAACSITDSVTGATGRPVASYLHFHPDFNIAVTGDRLLAEAPGLKVTVEHTGYDSVEVVRGQTQPPAGWYQPAFGVRIPATVIVLRGVAREDSTFNYRIAKVGMRSVA